MKQAKTIACLLTACYLFASCAMSYRPINPPTLRYPQGDSDNFAYKYDVLSQTGNRKLAKKETKTQIRIVAVRIYNNTTQTLKYGANYNIYSGDRVADILAPQEATANVKEIAPLYFLYLLLTPTTLTDNSGTSSNHYPIGVVLGPGISLLNFGIASGANSHFRKELEEYNIVGKEIKPGETAYGLIAIQSPDFAPLTIK